MGANDPVRRLAILYMVKSGRIAKSAGPNSLLSKARKALSQAGWTPKDIWYRFTGARSYVKPRAQQIRTAVDLASPAVTREAIDAANKAYLDRIVALNSITNKISPEQAAKISDEVRNVMTKEYQNTLNKLTDNGRRLASADDYRKAFDSARRVGQEKLKNMVAQVDQDIANNIAKAVPFPKLDTNINISAHTDSLINALGIEDVAPEMRKALQNMLIRQAMRSRPLPADEMVTDEVKKQLYKEYPWRDWLKTVGTRLGLLGLIEGGRRYYSDTGERAQAPYEISEPIDAGGLERAPGILQVQPLPTQQEPGGVFSIGPGGVPGGLPGGVLGGVPDGVPDGVPEQRPAPTADTPGSFYRGRR